MQNLSADQLLGLLSRRRRRRRYCSGRLLEDEPQPSRKRPQPASRRLSGSISPLPNERHHLTPILALPPPPPPLPLPLQPQTLSAADDANVSACRRFIWQQQ